MPDRPSRPRAPYVTILSASSLIAVLAVGCEEPTDLQQAEREAPAGAEAGSSFQESPFLYGIHDADPSPQEFLGHLEVAGVTGWITATVAIGSNPNDTGGDDFSRWENAGHTVIVRLNNGYCRSGTIPPEAKYDDFARRAANYVSASRGAHIWVIGNETNLANEWPVIDGRLRYVSPESYATLFRKTYDAIKAVRPNDKVISQAIAPFAGPYGPGSTCDGLPHDGNPLNWVQYMNRMLTAIKTSGGIDGIGVHINSRGYTQQDIHSTAKVNAGGQALHWSFYVYKDWVDHGIPADLYHLPLYATESNGVYYWSGGHPGNPGSHYEPGWVQEVYAEIDRYNQAAAAEGKPIYRAVNLYRWCAWCDGWNIDNSPFKGQILADLDAAVAQRYRWPQSGGGEPPPPPPPEPGGDNVARDAVAWRASSTFSDANGGDKAIDGVVSAASKWTSDGGSAQSWLALDLGGVHEISEVTVRHAGAAGEMAGFNTAAYRIESGASIDGPWTTLASVNNGAGDPVTTSSFSSAPQVRWIRLFITDAGIDNYARIPEMEVYGRPVAGDGNLVANGDFSAGLEGWSSWLERGGMTPRAVGGALSLEGVDFNGGVYQQFSTGGAGKVVSVAGRWFSGPTQANAQWAEVLVINGARQPVDGQDIAAGQADVVLIYKNDTWASPGGWSGPLAETSPVASAGSFVAAGDVATLVLKAGSVTSTTTGVSYDDIRVESSGTSGNSPPTARATADPTSGVAPLAVTLDGSGSSDPEGDPLSYNWELGDGTTASTAVTTHTYQEAGTYLARLTVSDGLASSEAALEISVTRSTVDMPPGCPDALNFPMIRADLAAQGKEMALAKIGFHVGPGGNQTGLGDWMRCLDAGGVPFFLKSADAAGQIWEGARLKAESGVPHVLVYRKSVGDGWNWDVPNYDLPPAEAAASHWERHIDEFPPELEPYKHLIWLESINEVDKNRSEWLGEFAYHTAQIALRDGYNWAAFGWSSGEPEREHWEGPWMREFLRLASENPTRIAIALHEYSYVRDNLDRLFPNLVGRFQMLYDVTDGMGLARPTVLVTEFGWVYDDIAPLDQAMNVDLPWAAQLYADYPEVLGAAIWYLGPGFGGISDRAQRLIAPLTEYSLQTYFVLP